jgi:hypothetical protein
LDADLGQMIKTEEKKVVLKAIDELGRRVTVADVAAKTGLPILVVAPELNKVAAEANGHMEVSKVGDIAYSFKPGFQNAYAATGFNKKLQDIGKKTFEIGFMILRMSFGIMLVLSFLAVIVLIFIAILAMNKGGDGDSDSGFNFDFFDFMILRDLFYWGTFATYPPYVDYSRPATTRPPKTNFLHNCFSFLFGDGDPNAHLEERKWQLVAHVIRKHNGVVAAEQIAPYTGADPKNEDGMLPVLVRFNGKPDVTDDGHILYTFPSLQVSASALEMSQSTPAFLREFPRQFTTADQGDLIPVYLLAGFNLLGSWWLLAQSAHIPALNAAHLLIVVLFWYGTFFVGVPLFRWAGLQYLNTRIESRNDQRKASAELVSHPQVDLKKKLEQATEHRINRTQISKKDVVYTTEKDALDQKDDLDDKFEQLEGEQKEFEPPKS